MTTHDDDHARDRAGLEALAHVPPPRRTDDAFARRVADDVARKRAPRWVFLPAVAAGAAAITMAVVHRPHHERHNEHPHDVAVVTHTDAPPDAHTDTHAEIATDTDTRDDEQVAEDLADNDDDFAMPGIDGSDEQELLAFEARLDQALEQRKP